MRKIIFFISVLVIVVVILAAAVFKGHPPTTPDYTGSNSGFGQATDVNKGQTGSTGGEGVLPSTQSTMTITTASGSALQVRDFIHDPDTYKDPLNKGQYYLGYHYPEVDSDPTATENPPYVINYSDSNQLFDIALFQEPIVSVRAQAEQDLMNRLGINQAQMCSLRYVISVPNSVNQYYAGANLGFSFCPGAVELAQ